MSDTFDALDAALEPWAAALRAKEEAEKAALTAERAAYVADPAGYRAKQAQASAPVFMEPSPELPPKPTPLVFDPDAKAPDQLNRNLLRSLQRDAEILELPFNVDDPKTNNLIVATSAATKATATKVDQNRLIAERNPDALERVINRVKQLVQERDERKEQPAMIDAVPTVVVEPSRQISFDESIASRRMLSPGKL